MSTEMRLRAVLQGVRYRDWNFIVTKDEYDLFSLQVAFGAPDAQSGQHTNWKGRKWRLSMHMTDSEVVQTALKAVLTAVEHEAREGFMFRGRAIFGPHLSVEKLWALADDPANLDVRE